MREMIMLQKGSLYSVEGQRKLKLFFAMILCLFLLMSIFSMPVYASKSVVITIPSDSELEGIDKMHGVVGWIAGWAAKIGLVVAFFGALQTVLGFMNDDADSKVRGLKTLAAGFMLWGIAMSVNTFFTA